MKRGKRLFAAAALLFLLAAVFGAVREGGVGRLLERGRQSAARAASVLGEMAAGRAGAEDFAAVFAGEGGDR